MTPFSGYKSPMVVSTTQMLNREDSVLNNQGSEDDALLQKKNEALHNYTL